jgi:Icc-related predicted phosphoesterase
MIGVIGDVHWNAHWVQIAAEHAAMRGATTLLFVGDIADARPGMLLHPRFPSYEAGVFGVFQAARSVFSGPILFVPGNHDAIDPRVSELAVLEVENIDQRVVEVDGLRIGGLGGALPAGGWPYEWAESDAYRRLSLMGRVDVLLCHNPPKDTLALRYGSEAIATYIDEHQPRFCVFGHVHEAVGVTTRGSMRSPTVCLNAGSFGPPNARLQIGFIETGPDRGWIEDLDRREKPFDPRVRS